MADPPSYDHDLLKRLNALKKTNITLDTDDPTLSIPRTRSTPETDLASRLRSLRDGVGAGGSSPSPSPKARVDSVTSVSSKGHLAPRTTSPPPQKPALRLLRDGTEDSRFFMTTTNIIDPADDHPPLPPPQHPISEPEIRSVLAQARSVLAARRPKPDGAPPPPPAPRKADPLFSRDLGSPPQEESPETPETHDSDASDASDDSSRDRAREEAREANDIVAQLLEELELERKNAPAPAEPAETDVVLPAVPARDLGATTGTGTGTGTGVNAEKDGHGKRSLDFEADIAARMAALRSVNVGGDGSGGGNSESNTLPNLPSAPTSAVGSGRKRGGAGAGPVRAVREEEEESWCVICMDEATVLCYGCAEEEEEGGKEEVREGVLYCARCWKEGHMGEGAGREERGHEWRRYRRGG